MRTAIHSNRFGLGARPGDAVPSDPQADLLAQLQRFDPKPAPIAALPRQEWLVAQLIILLTANQGNIFGERARAAAIEMGIPAGYTHVRLAVASHNAAAKARTEVAVQSNTPFAERLVHFWANHFAVSGERIPARCLAGNMEFDAIRPNLMGRFETLLVAAVRHPAMMLYLDQPESVGPNSPVGQRIMRSRAALSDSSATTYNENLAREILELHTVGVNGGYGQADVGEFARALTGWSLSGHALHIQGLRTGAVGSFLFQPDWHEPGPRRVLGKNYAPAGEAQSLAILKDLAAQPQTATFIATKLAAHFVADVPPPALVERMARKYLETDGELASVYEVLVRAPEAWTTPLAKFKSPWDWAVSAARALGPLSSEQLDVSNFMNALGQDMWMPLSPAGWPDRTAGWASSDAMARRVEVADKIAQLAGPRTDAASLAPAVLPGTLSERTRMFLAEAAPGPDATRTLLLSPEFMRR